MESKAKCVRIPVSCVNPVVKPKVVKAVTNGEWPIAERAMDVVDCVLRAVKRRSETYF